MKSKYNFRVIASVLSTILIFTGSSLYSKENRIRSIVLQQQVFDGVSNYGRC